MENVSIQSLWLKKGCCNERHCCYWWLRFTNLYFVVRWCRRTKISNLANSFPGHMWIPLPNGIKVLGFGAAWQIIKQNLSRSWTWYHTWIATKLRLVGKTWFQHNNYLKSWGIKFFWLLEVVWTVVYVPK